MGWTFGFYLQLTRAFWLKEEQVLTHEQWAEIFKETKSWFIKITAKLQWSQAASLNRVLQA